MILNLQLSPTIYRGESLKKCNAKLTFFKKNTIFFRKKLKRTTLQLTGFNNAYFFLPFSTLFNNMLDFAYLGFRRFQTLTLVSSFRGEGIKHLKHLKLFSTTNLTNSNLVWDFSIEISTTRNVSGIEDSHI